MKNLTNNQENNVLFVKSGEDVSGISSVVLRQLGSDKEVTIPASTNVEDCFTITIDILLNSNQFANGSYSMKVLNSDGNVVFETTVNIDGNNDSIRAYLVIDE